MAPHLSEGYAAVPLPSGNFDGQTEIKGQTGLKAPYSLAPLLEPLLVGIFGGMRSTRQSMFSRTHCCVVPTTILLSTKQM